MSFAVNYHKWILDELRQFIGRDLVEVGAGTGKFSALLLDEGPDTIALVEPSEMFAHLTRNVTSERAATRFYKNIFADVAVEIAKANRPDTIVYINVLEHIEDDRHELSLIYECLQPGGKALIFVPALPILFGEFDRQIGHFRRYTKKDLSDKAIEAGFTILRARYFDLMGILPWYVKYKVLKSASLETGAIKLYDKIVVPVEKIFESIIAPPIGKNLLFVLEKSA
jgi:SAM-dependent methyltransferase